FVAALLDEIDRLHPGLERPRVIHELTRRGMSRQDAHERVRMASMQALAESRPLADVLGADTEVIRFCSRDDLITLLAPDAYIGTSVAQVNRVIEKLKPLVL
ncbi:MAG: adenylosuccinate lyase, partial [Methanoregula sp.]